MKYLKSYENIKDGIELYSIPKIFNELKRYEKSDSPALFRLLLSEIERALIGKIIMYTAASYNIRKGKVESIEMDSTDDINKRGLDYVDFYIHFTDDKNIKNVDLLLYKELPINILKVETDAEKYNM
jgi:hypothetical protein